MTLYAYDETGRALIAVWETGIGRSACTVAEVGRTVDQDDVMRLVAALSTLSRLAWRTYTHPASAADSMEPNSEGWRRQGERDAFADVLPAISKPNLPEGGLLEESYVLVEEAAHRVGRALHRIDDPALVDRVVDEVGRELAAVEQAELGDLSGRARQAVQLTRADASPLQVAAADDLLRERPLGSSGLLQEVDPTAAAVAAAHWLQAAAEVAGEVAECRPEMVVIEADNIEALAVRTPTLVLERLQAGESPRKVVTDLVAAAMTAAEGVLADPGGLVEEIAQARAKAERFAPGDAELLAELMPRITPLDPMRPARDLLEDLLDGIRGCWLLYREHAGFDSEDLDDFGDGEEADEQADEHGAEQADEADEEFFDAVRAEAAAHHDRLV
ncbi:hypothetical protein FHS29_005259 [Saccharothrix tamanrassetensis]|uniref:Uncharacterized protein n=1 Tax=Saccharothrix tamanrassetensis TaxID=1051531 RepID=A0A841CM46_9PSEU|nr:hypothetical protein [Saccharothrix tamanrassetensis]MBB5958651.1 hypothetical protein [Saccharothrix tamanrassetensis]